MSRSINVFIDSKLMSEIHKRKNQQILQLQLYMLQGNVLDQMKQFCPHLVWIISPDHIHSKPVGLQCFQQQVFEEKRHGVQPQNGIPGFSLHFPKELSYGQVRLENAKKVWYYEKWVGREKRRLPIMGFSTILPTPGWPCLFSSYTIC